ncbi:copper amine oxidase N-terminal domain-containing protein [Filifactor alocis]|uniref:copper amine oxidase N-terminal domain-containing protein n=1 Tax=Filifactor alocis TaxID=143361 RepID=UPI003F9F00F5
MKKKLSLVVAGLMALTLAPVNSAFALKTESSAVVSVEDENGEARFSAVFEIEDADTAIVDNGEISVQLLGEDVKLTNLDVKVGANVQASTIQTDTYATCTTVNLANPVAVGTKLKINGKVKFDNAKDGEYKVVYDLTGIGLGKVEKVYAKLTTTDGTFTKVVESSKKVARGTRQELAAFEVKGAGGDNFVVELPSSDFVWELGTKVNGANIVAGDIDGRKLKFTMPAGKTKIVVKPVITVEKNAPKGDIELDVTKGDKTDTIKVGEYVDYAVNMKLVKTLKEELADGNTYKVDVKVETADKAPLPRYIDFEVEGADVKTTSANLSGDATRDFDDNFTWTNPAPAKDNFKMTLEVKPDWDAKGDVVLKASGRGMDDLSLTILKVTPVAQMKVEEKEVLGGATKVAVNDIVITETKAGAFKSGKRFGVSLAQLKLGGVVFDDKGTIEAEGIAIKDYKLDKHDETLYFTINGRSKKDAPAKITLKDVQVASNRALPFGSHKLTFVNVDTEKATEIKRGTNYMYEAKEEYKLSDINAENFIKVVDKVSKVKKTTIFTLGSADYTVEGEAMKLDAPVFTQDNYTMLPVRAIAEALGVEVVWNQENLTATFIDGDIVVSVTQNAKILYKNGNQYPMTTKATVTADRMFIPVSSVGDAFGLTRDYDYTYNKATKQVTIYPKKETTMEEKKADEVKPAEEVKPEEKKAEETK